MADEIAAIQSELPPWAGQAWQRLFDMVNEFEPDIVVLTARKMPRICEALQVKFSKKTLVISDLAVPFVASYFRDSRVAIVDDVVNFGSTLSQVRSGVEKFAPAAIQLFSLARRSSTTMEEVRCAHAVPLNETQYSEYVRSVPAAISYIRKPYDLAFPLVQGRYRIPFRSADEIVELLKRHFGSESFRVIPSPYVNSPIRRISLLFFQGNDAPPKKMRLYFDNANAVCSIVPMVLSHHISEDQLPVRLSSIRALRDQLKASLDEKGKDAIDAVASVALFTSSLDWFVTSAVYSQLQTFFDFGNEFFSVADAKLIFGPKIKSITESLRKELAADSKSPDDCKKLPALTESPFLERFDVDRLISLSSEKLKQGRILTSDPGIDCYSYLLAIIDSLADLVGAKNPDEYDINWPYSKAEISNNPYFRLRIGPTIPDLAKICKRLHQSVTNKSVSPHNFVETLSSTLDALIDQGAIVPTFANYDHKTYRIYRRGEGPGQDIGDMVACAWAASEKALSVTRVAKILSTLSHSQKYHKLLKSSAQPRGLVGGVHQSSLGAEPENLATFMRSTGQLRAVD